MQKLFFVILGVILLMKVSIGSVLAANYYWVGGSTDSNISNPANWRSSPGSCANSSNVIVPGIGDDIYFYSNCVNNAIFDIDMIVNQIVLNDDYTGTVTLNGNNLTVNEYLYVDSGEFIVENEGNVDVGINMIVGAPAGDTGVVRVDGLGSSILVTGKINVGVSGTGYLNITNGGSVEGQSATYDSVVLGNAEDVEGTISVDGIGSSFVNSGGGRVRVGNNGIGYIKVLNGASASIGYMYLGYSPTSAGHMIVSGNGSVLNANKSYGLSYIGRQGEGTLTVSDGGVANINAMPIQIGGLSTAIGTIEVTGENSELNLLADNCNARLGYEGVGRITLSSGSVSVTGNNSLITVADLAGSNGTFDIGSGSTKGSVSTTLGVVAGLGTATFLGDWDTPSSWVSNEPQTLENNQLRMEGSASIVSPYTISSVSYSVNGGGYLSATASDGAFDESTEAYYFDFDPINNQPKDINGNLIEGYTVRVKSTDAKTGTRDRVFYFLPFNAIDPDDDVRAETEYLDFEFKVNAQRENMQDALEKFQIKVRRGGDGSTSVWETLIDDIPVDFRSVKGNSENKLAEIYGSQDTNNGVYETDEFYATYSEESSRIRVYSKVKAMSGVYQWKVVAVDKAGHTQETGTRDLFVKTESVVLNTNNFPLAILNISGLGNPNINSYNLSDMKSEYATSSVNPVFFGIAWVNSLMRLDLSEVGCETDCEKSYTTIANFESRFGINIPEGDLGYGKEYLVNLAAMLGDKYVELPEFSLKVGK